MQKINLRYTPTDDLEISLLSSKMIYDNNANSSGLTKDKSREVGSDLAAFNKSEVLLNALSINYSISDKLSLSSTTAHRKYDEITANDFDYSNTLMGKFHLLNDSTYTTLSEELKLNYQDTNIKLVTGLFLEKYDTDYSKQTDMGGGYMDGELTQENDSLGLFSHITYNINDKLSVLGGLRYDKVNQEYKDPTQTINNDDSEVSPKIGLTYDIKDNMMTYTTISKGYRAGGFNNYASSGYSKTYDKETLYSYEVGLKGTSMDDRLAYSMAVYHMDISDMQVDIYTNGGGHVVKTNAAEATSQGVETSLQFQATDSINLFTGFSYNNIEFDKYHDGIQDYSGKTTMYSPKYNFNLGVLYRASSGYYANADMSGYGDTYLDNANKYKRDAYEIVNAKIGYEQESYDIYLYAKNLFDKNYDMDGVWGGYYNIYSEPQEIGLQLAYRF